MSSLLLTVVLPVLAVLGCVLFAVSASSSGWAAVAPTDRFAAADADSNGTLSPAEFKAAFPGMRDAAFAAIDANADTAIDRTEWATFTQNHGASGSQAKGSLPASPAQQGTPLPLVTPPQGK